MQTDYLFNGLKGYAFIKKFNYIFYMENNEANKRYKILKFFDKYGIDATIEAFDVSRRTIYRCKAKLKHSGILSLKPKSCKPKQLRIPLAPNLFVNRLI